MKTQHTLHPILWVGCLWAFFTLTIPVSAQQFNSNVYYRLIAKHNGQVLDVVNASKDNQADVVVRPWNGGDNQQWKLEALGDGSYRLIARHSGKVLDVNNSLDNQANIVQHDWHGGDNQRFLFEPLGDGYYRVVAKFSRKAMDVNITNNPGNVVQHEWHGGDNQRWKVEVVQGSAASTQFDPNQFYRLVAKHNGYVLDVENASRDNQADVIARPWNGGGNQQWKLEALGDGSYRLTARHSGKVLDVNDYQTNQANVVQHDWHGGNNQRFIFEPVGDGYYKVIAKFSGKVLDVNLDARANVVQHDWHTGDNQRWKLEAVSGSGGNDQPSGQTDLTGLWQDDRGAKYQVRQMGNQVWWYMDKRPEVANVFRGSISGNTINGEWVDVPDGQLRNTGSLQLKVVNNNRLEKMSSSFDYGGSVWTRR